MKALVTREMNQYAVEDVTLDPPKAGELRIKMGATGVCHSDLSVINGTLPLGKPMVLGHEGAGMVAEIGAGVTGFNIGDHVVLSFAPACGVCTFCKSKQPQFCGVGAPHGRMLDGTARMHDKSGADLGVMLITHYQRILNYISPDFVHVMLDGRVVESGGADLALHLEEHGYDWVREKYEVVNS